MGASASVSLIPLKNEFDLASAQNIVGEAEWNEGYEKQFRAAAGENGAVPYETFVKVYQRNILAQTSAKGLLNMLLKKFRRVLSGEGSEEAAAVVKLEQDRRIKEALAFAWTCPNCSVEDQSGRQCSICMADNPRLAAILAEESASTSESPITERDVLTVQILLEKVSALEKSVLNMTSFLKAIEQDDIVSGGSSQYDGVDAMSLKLYFLQACGDCVSAKARDKKVLQDDLLRYDNTIQALLDPANMAIVARTPTAKVYLQQKVERLRNERKQTALQLQRLQDEEASAAKRYQQVLQQTRQETIPHLLNGLEEYSHIQDRLLSTDFQALVQLENMCQKMQQRAIDREWLDPFKYSVDETTGSGSTGKRKRKSKQTTSTSSMNGFPYCIRQSSHDKDTQAPDKDDRSSLTFLLSMYRSATVVNASVMSDRLLQWAKAGGNVPVGAARPCPLKSLERSIQKANLHYNGDFSRLLDLVRGSITFSSLAELNACLRAIHNDSSVQVLRVKARLGRQYKAVTPEAIGTGYRDVLLNIRAAPEIGVGDHIFEVQLHLDVFEKNQQNGGAKILRIANELQVIRYSFLQVDPPNLEHEHLSSVADGFARTLDLQGVGFRAPGEISDDEENGLAAKSQPPGTAIANADAEREPEPPPTKLIDALVQAYCVAPTSQLNVLRLSATNITTDMICKLCDGVEQSNAGNRLKDLQLAFTGVSVDVIPKIQKAFPFLKRLSMNDCHLLGELPAEALMKLTCLEELSLQNNQLQGQIPETVGGLTCMVNMPLFNNRLSGHIPPTICALERLQHLVLFDNQLSGPIPSCIGKLTQLETIDLHNNKLNGPIPPSIGKLSNLRSLVVHGNELSGQIPVEITKLLALKTLWIGDNQLDGKIPMQLGYLRNLESLQARNNRFVGKIPASLGTLAKLETCDLSWNQLTGKIPKTIAKCSMLANLTLDGNSLTGQIPSALSGLKELVSLHLYSNQLTGKIPAELRRLQQLSKLSLFKNPSLEVPDECPLNTEGQMCYKSRADVQAFLLCL